MRITGYTDRWAFRPGEEVAVRVSTSYPHYAARLVRHAGPIDDLPDWGRHIELVEAVNIPGQRGVERPIVSGSSAVAMFEPAAPVSTLSVEVWPAMANTMRLLDLDFQSGRLEIGLSAGGQVLVNGEQLALRLQPRRWSRITMRIDRGSVQVQQVSLFDGTHTSDELDAQKLGDLERLHFAPHFEGRLAHPCLHDDQGRPLAAWNFGEARRNGATLPSELADAPDMSLINSPTLLVRSSDGGLDAAAFHFDDLSDAGWPIDFSFVLPEDLRSGVYGLVLTPNLDPDWSERSAFDILPLFVVPRAPTSRVALVLPTFSYRAYANSTFFEAADPQVFQRKAESWSAPLHDYASKWSLRSLYDTHAGGDGVALATMRRPQMTVRADYISLLQGFAHQLSADLSIVGWLEGVGCGYEVLTDEILHEEGLSALADYDVVITGSHPEYASPQVLCAYHGFAGKGGSILYLGGNGFYWAVGIDREDPSLVEVRRRDGVRTWTGRAGEHQHQTDDSDGGLWRNLGCPPNSLLGIGFAAHGYSGDGAYRLNEKLDLTQIPPHLGSVFAKIGPRPFGVAGLELDKHNSDLGEPGPVTILASTVDMPVGYVPAIEEFGALDAFLPRPDRAMHEAVRGDMVLADLPGGGRAFAVGSIRWASGLSDPDDRLFVRAVTTAALLDLLAVSKGRRGGDITHG